MGLSALPSATWVGINERFEQAHVHAHINLIGLCLDGAVRPALPAPSWLLRPAVWAAVQFALFNLGAVVCSRQHSAGAGASDGRARGGRLAYGARGHAHFSRKLFAECVQQIEVIGSYLD